MERERQQNDSLANGQVLQTTAGPVRLPEAAAVPEWSARSNHAAATPAAGPNGLLAAIRRRAPSAGEAQSANRDSNEQGASGSSGGRLDGSMIADQTQQPSSSDSEDDSDEDLTRAIALSKQLMQDDAESRHQQEKQQQPHQQQPPQTRQLHAAVKQKLVSSGAAATIGATVSPQRPLGNGTVPLPTSDDSGSEDSEGSSSSGDDIIFESVIFDPSPPPPVKAQLEVKEDGERADEQKQMQQQKQQQHLEIREREISATADAASNARTAGRGEDNEGEGEDEDEDDSDNISNSDTDEERVDDNAGDTGLDSARAATWNQRGGKLAQLQRLVHRSRRESHSNMAATDTTSHFGEVSTEPDPAELTAALGLSVELATDGAGKIWLERRAVPPDHSCLFAALGYLCEPAGFAAGRTDRLRAVVAAAALADPQPEARAVLLGMPVGTYAAAIRRPGQWGVDSIGRDCHHCNPAWHCKQTKLVVMRKLCCVRMALAHGQVASMNFWCWPDTTALRWRCCRPKRPPGRPPCFTGPSQVAPLAPPSLRLRGAFTCSTQVHTTIRWWESTSKL